MPTGAFVARRNGKVFITGNSGFPKSLDISKALDKANGIDREDKFEGSFDRRCGPTGNKKCDKCGKWLVSGSPCQCPRPQDMPQTDAAKLWHGWGSALKPAVEPIVVAMKPLDGTFAQNAIKHGVAGLNIDGCRIACEPFATTNGTALGLMSDDAWDNTKLRGTKFKSHSQGRWPANLILDEEAAALLDQQSGTLTSGLRKATHADNGKDAGCFGAYRGGMRDQDYGGDSGGASRFFYVAKASRAERGKTNSHPTVKPLKLMRYLVKLVTYPQENLILDPFCGSGTTGVAAAKLGCGFVGIEQERPHFDIAVSRIQKALREQREKLFT